MAVPIQEVRIPVFMGEFVEPSGQYQARNLREKGVMYQVTYEIPSSPQGKGKDGEVRPRYYSSKKKVPIYIGGSADSKQRVSGRTEDIIFLFPDSLGASLSWAQLERPCESFTYIGPVFDFFDDAVRGWRGRLKDCESRILYVNGFAGSWKLDELQYSLAERYEIGLKIRGTRKDRPAEEVWREIYDYTEARLPDRLDVLLPNSQTIYTVKM